MKPIFPKLIVAENPYKLNDAVQEALKDYDLYSPLFSGHAGQLCQWVTPSMAMYEYRLVIAEDAADLELQVKNLCLTGWDFIFNTVLWGGQYLQWMCQMNNQGVLLRDATQALAADLPAGLQMVADARSVLRLAPYPVVDTVSS